MIRKLLISVFYITGIISQLTVEKFRFVHSCDSGCHHNTETQLFRLEEANRALRLLKERTINGAGVLEIPAP